MTRDQKRLRWFALAGAAFVATIAVKYVLSSAHDTKVDPPRDPLWGLLMGISCYALVNATALRGDQIRLKDMTQTRRIGIWAIITAVMGGAGVLLLAGQEGMVALWPEVLTVNMAVIATMLILSLVAPTEANGLLLPLGDERFRANQHRAQSVALRIAFVGCLVFGTLAHYRILMLPISVTLAILATLIASLYLAVLWWLERRGEA